MKLTFKLSDELYAALEVAAAARGAKSVETLLAESAQELVKLDVRKPHIILEGEQINKISLAVGGRIIKTAEDVAKLFQDNFKIGVNGIEVALTPEDTNAMKEHFESTSYKSFDQYVSDSIQEALSLYLWGSTRGILMY